MTRGTEAVRRAIQHSQESLKALSKRHGINQKTVAKWKKRISVADLRTGPTEPGSTVLSVEEEAVIVAFRQRTLLPLDDCLYPPRYAAGPTARCMNHMFDMRCEENGIEHRLTRIRHPSTNGQVERMNRTIKDATVRRDH